MEIVRFIDDVNAKIQLFAKAGTISGLVATVSTKIAAIGKITNLKERAAEFNKLTNDGTSGVRTLTQQIGTRIKAALCGAAYGNLTETQTIFKNLTKYANVPKNVDDKTVNAALEDLLKLVIAAKKLSDKVDLIKK